MKEKELNLENHKKYKYMAQLENRNIDVQHCRGFSTNRGQADRASSTTCKTDLSAHLVKQVSKDPR